ncbi:MAG: Rrf2 family transcriptional regulator, partial [Armatimonadetes bacterium]|nr:Rrf2 family transcriptional regulator [Armatimonadota bacterium]
VLARPASQINIREILEALEGPVLEIEPMEPNLRERAKNSGVSVIWERFAEVMENLLQSITLAQVCTWEQEKRSRQPLMFYI